MRYQRGVAKSNPPGIVCGFDFCLAAMNAVPPEIGLVERQQRCAGRCVAAGAAAALILCAFTAAQAGAPRRIISLAPSVTEMLFALGAGDRVVGVTVQCDYPPAARAVDRIGTFLAPSVEKVIAKRPDLVIGVPSPGNRDPVGLLRSLGMTVLIVDPEGVEATFDALRQVAGAVGLSEKGKALTGRIRARIARVSARLQAAPRRRVLMVVDRSPLIAVGGRTYQDELIRLAHGSNVAAAAGRRWPHLSLEFVIAQAPEVIIDGSMNPGRSAGADREFWGRFATIPAVRNGRIYGYRLDHLLRPGPRLAESVETMARFIHPERWPTP